MAVICLVDTNVLLRFSDRTDPRHTIARIAARKLRADGHHLKTTPQNFTEFWNAATRPQERNGFGMRPEDADRLLCIAERIFPLLPDSPAIYPEWRRLVVSFGVSGVKVHDARLVASMIVYDVKHILTFNTSDFSRYASEGIVSVDPMTIGGFSV